MGSGAAFPERAVFCHDGDSAAWGVTGVQRRLSWVRGVNVLGRKTVAIIRLCWSALELGSFRPNLSGYLPPLQSPPGRTYSSKLSNMQPEHQRITKMDQTEILHSQKVGRVLSAILLCCCLCAEAVYSIIPLRHTLIAIIVHMGIASIIPSIIAGSTFVANGYCFHHSKHHCW